MTKVGVFDSGVGGKSVVRAIEKALPDTEVIFADDKQHVPYGTKSPDELLGYVVPIIQRLEGEGCQAIVIACNTVSITIISQLREAVRVPLIGMEPMVKPAAATTKSDIIAIFATPTTLASKRYHALKEEFAKGIQVLEPDCSDWSAMIEANKVDKQKIEDVTDKVCRQGADVIVLGCTHYHWIEDIIKQSSAKQAVVLQPEKPVISQLERVLQQQH